MSHAKNPAYGTLAERRLQARKRVNFLLDEEGSSSWHRPRGDQDLWACARRGASGAQRWDAFEKWQEEAKLAQAKTVDGVQRLPRKLSLKAIFNSR